jgi:thymidylate synthase
VATLNITVESLQLEYRTVLDDIMRKAIINEPRGQRVYDAGYTVLEIAQCQFPQLPVQTGRKVNLDIAAIEALQLVAGEGTHDAVLRVAPQFAAYAEVIGSGDDGDPMRWNFHGNYGDRMNTTHGASGHNCGARVHHFSWLECAVHKIKSDRDTRQAVINIWQNERDSGQPGKKDYPCTVAIGFRVYRARLDMHVTMRSNDAWKGLPYDVFQFNQAHHTVASMLQVPLGRYYHNAWSMHVYEEDVEKMEAVYDRSYLADTVLPRGFTHSTDAMSVIGFPNPDVYKDNPAQQWYANRLRRYLDTEYDSTQNPTEKEE